MAQCWHLIHTGYPVTLLVLPVSLADLPVALVNLPVALVDLLVALVDLPVALVDLPVILVDLPVSLVVLLVTLVDLLVSLFSGYDGCGRKSRGRAAGRFLPSSLVTRSSVPLLLWKGNYHRKAVNPIIIICCTLLMFCFSMAVYNYYKLLFFFIKFQVQQKRAELEQALGIRGT